MDFLNTDIRELEIARSLRRLGEIRVTEWDFRDALPAVKRVANQEVDLLDVMKRLANYRVIEWDFRTPSPPADHAEPPPPAAEPPPPPAPPHDGEGEAQATLIRLKNFLQYVAVNLIDQPNHAQIKVMELGPRALRFKLVLVKKDVSMLIGTGGFTAAAIRSMLQAAGARHGVQVLLQIHSHEEEIEAMTREAGK